MGSSYSPSPTAASDACEWWPPVRLQEQDKVDTKYKERYDRSIDQNNYSYKYLHSKIIVFFL
jgi:hypothetical protein